ncbi:MAG: hypothetical protein QM535_15830 [Limnohabitans sp.]|nr:hypothetical protein [Limnohabitans sp.]
MKYLVVAFLFLTQGLSAQDRNKIPVVAFPRIDVPKPEDKKGQEENAPQYSLNKPFEPKLFKIPPKKYDPPQANKQIEFSGGGSDLNVGKQYAEKLNKTTFPSNSEGRLDPKIFRRNQYFGEFKLKSKYITLTYRDFGLVDGDAIRIWLDGKVIVDMIIMEGSSKTIQIGLIDGINKIEIEALNEGAYSPNTGEFKFVDDQGKVLTSDQWDIAANFKASFIFVKEK